MFLNPPSLRSIMTSEDGAIGVVTAIVLPVMIILMGLVLDIDYGYATRSKLQTTADASALAGALGASGGITLVRTNAKTIAALNMPSAQWGSVLVDADIQLGNWASSTRTFTSGGTPTNAVQVVARTAAANGNAIQTFFARYSGLNTLNINATSIAAVNGGNLCFLALDNKNTTSVSATGTSIASMLCGIGSNSTSNNAVSISGNAVVTAPTISAVGGVSSAGSASFGSSVIQTGVAAQGDPYTNVNAPASSTYPAASCPNLKLTSGTQNGLKPGQFRNMTGASAGYFCVGDMNLNNANLTLSPGIYVIDGGGLTISGSASLSCSGCTIIFSNRSSSANAPIGGVNINGSGAVNLTGSSSGTYIGLAMYQDRRATTGNQNTFIGASGTTVIGTFYFPKALVNYTGTAVQTPCFQLIAWDMTFSGTTNVGNTCPAGFGTFGTANGKLSLVN